MGWERRYLSRLSGTLIDGAILVTPTVMGASFGAPVVAVDPHTGGNGVPTVDSDNLRGAQLAIEHLIGLGHRRIGFLAGRRDLESARLRELGYQRALSEAGIEFDPGLVRVGSYEEGASLQAARELLGSPDRPTAVFAANDLSAITTIDVALTLGLSVPDELSVIGFDNIPESALIDAGPDHDRAAHPADGPARDRHARRAAPWRHPRVDARDAPDPARRAPVVRLAHVPLIGHRSVSDRRWNSGDSRPGSCATQQLVLPFTIARRGGARGPAG